MFSAPHCLPQRRDGKTKFAEPETGVLALLLHDSLNCPIIYSTSEIGDANYDMEHPYKQVLISYLNEHNDVKLLIDLHQLSPSRSTLIDIGTGEGNNLCGKDEIASMVSSAFKKRNFSDVEIDYPFKSSKPYTISSFISKCCNIPCIQVEINSRLVMPEYEDYRFYDVYRAFIEIANHFHKFENRTE